MAKSVASSVLLMVLLTVATGQRQHNFQESFEAFQKLSAPLQASQQQQQCSCSYSATWTSVPLTAIGSNNLRRAGTLSYTIPSVIPSSASEVLVLAGIYCGSSSTLHQHIKIYTKEGTKRYEKYLQMYSHPQTGRNTNSDNMWFPMTSNRKIYMEIPSAHGSNCEGQLNAIGYRWTPDLLQLAVHAMNI